MIICPVCQTENDPYAVICCSCRGFLQNKIPNLDLFQTAWMVLENPRTAFQRIAIAEHKNYSALLFSLFGIAFIYALLWASKAGNRFESFFSVIIVFLFAGLIIGLVLLPIVSLVHWLISRSISPKAFYRNTLGIMAYSLVPVIISIIFILPIELLTFGMYFFTSNPDPMVINASSYIILLTLDGVFLVWSIILCLIGTKIGHQITWFKSAVVVLCVLVTLAACFYSAGRLIGLLPIVS